MREGFGHQARNGERKRATDQRQAHELQRARAVVAFGADALDAPLDRGLLTAIT